MSIIKSGSYFTIFALMCIGTLAVQKPPQCEVCTDVLTEVMKLAKVDSTKINPEVIKKTLINYCATMVGDGKKIQIGDDEKRSKFCFFVGADKNSATSIINEVTKPLAFHKPPEKVCDALKAKDSQICDLKFDKPIDWATIDINGMRVKQLKELLVKLKGECKGCTEKSEYIARINELKPKVDL